MKKIILNLLLVINLNAVDTHGSLTKFWETLDWDSFWNSFSFSFMGCDCKPKFLVDWCEAFFCDFLPAIQEQHLEPFANFSASPNPLTFVGLNIDSTDHIMGPKKGVTRKNSLQKEIDTASFQQINMLPFPIASIISFINPGVLDVALIESYAITSPSVQFCISFLCLSRVPIHAIHGFSNHSIYSSRHGSTQEYGDTISIFLQCFASNVFNAIGVLPVLCSLKQAPAAFVFKKFISSI